MPPRQLPNLINLILPIKLRLFPKSSTDFFGKQIVVRLQILEVIPLRLADGAFVPSPEKFCDGPDNVIAVFGLRGICGVFPFPAFEFV